MTYWAVAVVVVLVVLVVVVTAGDLSAKLEDSRVGMCVRRNVILIIVLVARGWK